MKVWSSMRSKNKVVPCLAEKWDVSADGLTYTFHLRPEKSSFQNGMPDDRR